MSHNESEMTGKYSDSAACASFCLLKIVKPPSKGSRVSFRRLGLCNQSLIIQEEVCNRHGTVFVKESVVGTE